MFNSQKEADHLEELCAKGEGGKALDALQSLDKQEQLAVIKQLRQDAKQEGGQVYIDPEKDQLVFDSPFNSVRK